VSAQAPDFLHTELTWNTLETRHFFVHYHDGSEWTARNVAAIAESIYGPLTSLYHHEPDQKVSFVIRDHDDYSNGVAYFYDNKIEIWAPAMDYELRGIHPWLKNVVTHEFCHIVQIQTAMKLGRRFPALYFQWFGYESERRPDVLYGFPNVLISYPLSFFLVPSWFAEGTAQYNHPDLKYDFWDSHRDMILRMYMLDGNPLSWEEMAVFGKTSLGNESAYNAGFSIVQYIDEHYGSASLERISRALGDLPRVTIDGAIKDALGISGEELFSNWKASKERAYKALAESLKAELVTGEVVESEGFGNFYPAFSPDGKTLAYVSNKGKDYFGQSSVYLYDIGTRQSRKITGGELSGVRSTLSYTPDGSSLVYAKTTSDNPHWSRYSDLYRYDFKTEEETRLTHGLRAFSPRVSPDGSRIAFVFGSDGTMNVGTCALDGSDIKAVTRVAAGHQVYTPAWSPDGSTIAFGYSAGHGQSLALVEAGGGGLRMLPAEGADCRNPWYSADGRTLYYSSDRTGIFNVYALDLGTGETRQVTNVLGGAFLPTVSSNGDLAFASYTSSGYKISMVPASSASPRPQLAGTSSTAIAGHLSEESPSPIATENPDSLHARPYRNMFTSLSLIPFLRVDNYNPKNKGIDIIKPGMYGVSSDVLDKLTLFGGAALNRKLERDLFLIFEFRDKLPLISLAGLEPVLSLELYSVSRKTTSSFTLAPSTKLITPEITYNLFEVDVSLRQPVLTEKTEARVWYTLSRYGADIGSFENPNQPGSLIPAFRNVYFVGSSLSAQLKMDFLEPDLDRDINPVGRSLLFRYAYEADDFNPEGDYKIESGLAVPQYKRFVFHRAEAQWNEHMRLPWEHQTVSLSLRGAGILGKTVDSFFDFYAGGVLGMKGYPFYALGGNTNATMNLTYRFPISRDLDFRILQFYFTKLFVSGFYDFGNAWSGSMPDWSDWKSDAGIELRLESFSFYAYPTRFFFSAAYGFNEFEKTFSGVKVKYGREWRLYFGVLFGFELGELGPSLGKLMRIH
jgi:Tol biopolymer transport system component